MPAPPVLSFRDLGMRYAEVASSFLVQAQSIYLYNLLLKCHFKKVRIKPSCQGVPRQDTSAQPHHSKAEWVDFPTLSISLTNVAFISPGNFNKIHANPSENTINLLDSDKHDGPGLKITPTTKFPKSFQKY